MTQPQASTAELSAAFAEADALVTHLRNRCVTLNIAAQRGYATAAVEKARADAAEARAADLEQQLSDLTAPARD